MILLHLFSAATSSLAAPCYKVLTPAAASVNTSALSVISLSFSSPLHLLCSLETQTHTHILRILSSVISPSCRATFPNLGGLKPFVAEGKVYRCGAKRQHWPHAGDIQRLWEAFKEIHTCLVKLFAPCHPFRPRVECTKDFLRTCFCCDSISLIN